MIKFFQRTTIALIWVVLVFIYPQFTNAETTQEMLKEGAPAYTLKEAKAIVKDVAPLVEKAVNRKFKAVPEIKIVDREEMAAVLQQELKPQLVNLYPGYSDEQLSTASSQQATIYSVALMGKYGIIDGNLYLLPKNIYPLMKLAKIDEKHAKPLLKLVVAHELVHALQNQETDFKRLFNINNIDQLNAFSATIEGQAVFVQEIVGRQMGLNDSVIEMSRILSAGAVTYDDPAMEMTNKIIATQFEQIYLGGKKFIEYYYNQGGIERIWDIIANLPVKSAMIVHPETYNPVKRVEINYTVLLEGLEQELDGEGWKTQNLEVGEMMIRSVYAKIEENKREEIILQIEHIQTFIAQKADPPSMFNASAIIIKNGSFAEEYISILEEMAQKNIKELESSPSLSINDFSVTNLNSIQADQARKMTFTVFEKNNPRGDEQKFVRISRGDLLLEFYTSNFELEDSVIIEMAEKVFSRYKELK